MKRIAQATLLSLFAAILVFLATSIAHGADGAFALEALANGHTMPDARTFGTIESNGAASSGKHFVPSVQRGNLPPGRYRIPGEATMPTATSYVPPAPNPAPALAIGRKFLRVAMTSAAELRPTTQVVTLVAIDTTLRPRRLTFAAPDETPSFIDSDADVTHLPGVRAIESDDNLSRAQHAFAGRDAWTRGVVALQCTTASERTILLGGGTHVRIEGLFRVANLPSFRAIGQQNVWDRDSDSAFWTIDPLVVVVRVPADARVFGGSESQPPMPVGTLVGNVGIVAPPGTAPLPPGRQGVVARESWLTGCGVGTNDLADLWEVERTFTTVPPQAHRSWPARVRKAFTERRIVLGMPRDAVAYVDGYPSIYGTVADMNARTVWTYDAPSPFNFEITFGHDGRVDSFHPPGMLP